MPSRRNVAKYEIEHSAWIGSSEIPVDYQSPHNGQTLGYYRSTRLLEPKFFSLYFLICSILCYHFV